MPPAVHPVNALLSRLKFRHLRAILALDELQSAAKVAARFHISPAAVSKTLAEIEDIVGMALFERGRRGMRPTDIGQEMIEGAALVTAHLVRLAESLHAVREGTRGQLSIAFRTNSVQPLLAQAICSFHEANPGVDISVIEGAIGDLANQVAEGQLDLLFAYEDPRLEGNDLMSAPVVAGQKVVVVASMTHPLLRHKRVTAKNLAEQQWCIPAHGSRMLHHLHTAFRALNTPVPERGIRTSDVAMTVNLLQTAHFLTVFPERIAAQLVAAKVARVLPFTLASRVEPVVVVWNGALKSREPACAFRNFIVRRAGEAAAVAATPGPRSRGRSSV
ncbi:MAG: LysR family transcriptional regulator [Polaromonas sp.]